MKGKKGKIQSKFKKTTGRPSEYTKEISDLICERVATHDCGLPKLCDMYDDMPGITTIQRWRYRYEGFRIKYAHAKLLQADLLAEQCLDISDNSTPEEVAVSRLRVDSRKWLASKLLPKQYGDKLLLEQKNEDNERLEEIRALRKKLDEENKREF